MKDMRLEHRSAAGGFFGMHSSKDYLKFAEECDYLARDAKTEQQRQILREMAEAWKELAAAVDRESSLSSS